MSFLGRNPSFIIIEIPASLHLMDSCVLTEMNVRWNNMSELSDVLTH